MIYTVTCNPSLDYIVSVDEFKLGLTNRTSEEGLLPGGKGINVSTVLMNMRIESTALGFVAGFTGNEIVRRLENMGVKNGFIYLESGFSRINVKLKSIDGTEINGQGPEISQEKVQILMEQLKTLGQGDVLFLSGSIPASMPDDIYQKIMESLEGKGVLIAVDATQELLLKVLPYHPFLIKPNNHELGEIFGVSLTTRKDVVPYGKKLQEMGARNVLVSMAKDGAILVAEDGSIYRQGVARGTVRNSVGAGDSMVAGFIAGYLETGDCRYALKLGTACGGATAFSDGIGTKQDIMELMETL